MTKFKRRFTRWYVRKGYGFSCDPFTQKSDFYCPWYIRPLLIFFSPSTYHYEVDCKPFAEGIIAGLRRGADVSCQE
jgi:hypothetical protein